jgi:predicted DNA-binding transcriptional regulator AlpA
MVKAGEAPAPVRLASGISAWQVGDLRSWLQEIHVKNSCQTKS